MEKEKENDEIGKRAEGVFIVELVVSGVSNNDLMQERVDENPGVPPLQRGIYIAPVQVTK
jgi:hypothetical protein